MKMATPLSRRCEAERHATALNRRRSHSPRTHGRKIANVHWRPDFSGIYRNRPIRRRYWPLLLSCSHRETSVTTRPVGKNGVSREGPLVGCHGHVCALIFSVDANREGCIAATDVCRSHAFAWVRRIERAARTPLLALVISEQVDDEKRPGS